MTMSHWFSDTPAAEQGYAAVPRQMIYAALPRLSGPAAKLWVWLAARCDSQTGVCVYGQRLIADGVGIHQTTVGRAAQELVATGLISAEIAPHGRTRYVLRAGGDAPTHQGDAPTHQGDAPTHQGDAPTHQGDAPTHQGDAPTHQGDAPTHHDSASYSASDSASPMTEAGRKSLNTSEPTEPTEPTGTFSHPADWLNRDSPPADLPAALAAIARLLPAGTTCPRLPAGIPAEPLMLCGLAWLILNERAELLSVMAQWAPPAKAEKWFIPAGAAALASPIAWRAAAEYVTDQAPMDDPHAQARWIFRRNVPRAATPAPAPAPAQIGGVQ